MQTHPAAIKQAFFVFNQFEHRKALKYDINGKSIKVARCDATYKYTRNLHAASHREIFMRVNSDEACMFRAIKI